MSGPEVSRPDKVLFPGDGITKGDLADYYARVADVLLPHAEDRPLSFQRFPDGIGDEGFLQKDVGGRFPDEVPTASVEKEGGSLQQVVCNDRRTLVQLVDQACITLHVWLARVHRPRHPDRLVFDLDPPGDGAFDEVRFAARETGALLRDLGLVPFVTLTGSRGLHVVVPLDSAWTFDRVRDFSRDAAGLLARRHPDRLTTEHRKAKREGRVFLDTTRNAYAQTVVAPYSVRALPGAPVATPLDWDEVGAGALEPRRYTVRNLFRRLAQKSDPWGDIERHARSLDGPRERLDALRDQDA